MKRKPLTLRSDENTVLALKELSAALGTPVNRIVNDAVKLYLASRIPEVERDLEAQLSRLRAARVSDPDFEAAIARFAEAEAAVADPLETVMIPAASPIHAEIRELLSA